MALVLPELPFAKNALDPHISEQTLEFHHGKHHNAYVTNGNKLIEGTEFADMAIEEIITKSAGDDSKAGIFNRDPGAATAADGSGGQTGGHSGCVEPWSTAAGGSDRLERSGVCRDGDGFFQSRQKD